MSQMKFLDDVDLGLCELQNHLLHIVGSAQTTQAQIYFNTSSSVDRLEYYDGATTQVPVTKIQIYGDSGNQGISGDKTATVGFVGDGITIDAGSTVGQLDFTNDHKTIQSMTDLSSTPGAGNDGYAMLWDNSTSSFKLIDLATVTTSGSFVTTNTVQTVSASKTFSAATTFDDNVTINGDLTISGAHTLTEPETVVIEDNLLYLNSNVGAVAPSQDAGFIINRGSSTNVGFIWDEGNGRFELIQTADDGTGTNIGASAYSDLIANAIRTTSTLTIGGTTTLQGDVFLTALTSETSPSGYDMPILDGGEVKYVSYANFRDFYGSKASGTITGNGVLTTFTFTHSLGNLGVDITIIEDSTGDKVFTTTRNTSATQSQISFKYAIGSGKTYTVIAQG
jgi:hypothetical protein